MKPTIASLRAEVTNAGFTPSNAGYEDDMNIFAFSIETCANTYGHPKFECHFSKVTRWLRITGKPDQLIPKDAPKQPRQSAKYGPDSRWEICRFRSEGSNLIACDAFAVTGFNQSWDAFHREVRSEDCACIWSMVNIETGVKFCEVEF